MEICGQEKETRLVDFDDLEPGEVFHWVYKSHDITSNAYMKLANGRYVVLKSGYTHEPPPKNFRNPVARLDACLVVKGEK